MVVMAGTGTDVGKTWVTCRAAHQLRTGGLAVAARKPAQSFAPEGAGPTDADLLAAATGENAADVCPPFRWYPKAMAPPMAAESLGLRPFSLADLVGEMWWPTATDVGLVEQAGGLGSPQAADGDGVDLVKLLAPDRVVLVAPSGLGTLSHIRLALRALGSHAAVVFLNHFDGDDEVHAANRRWLGAHEDVAVVVDPQALADELLSSRP